VKIAWYRFQLTKNTIKNYFNEKNPVRGGYLTGLVGGGNEGKEETSFLLLFIIKQLLCQLTKIMDLAYMDHINFNII
jgi:hypothetical protein